MSQLWLAAASATSCPTPPVQGLQQLRHNSAPSLALGNLLGCCQLSSSATVPCSGGGGSPLHGSRHSLTDGSICPASKPIGRPVRRRPTKAAFLSTVAGPRPLPPAETFMRARKTLAQTLEPPSSPLQDPSAGGRDRDRRAAGNQPCDACRMRLRGEAGVDVRVWHVQLISRGTKGRIFKGMPAGVQAHTLAAVCCFAHPKVGLPIKPGLSAAPPAAECSMSRGSRGTGAAAAAGGMIRGTCGWGASCSCLQPYHGCLCLSLPASDVHSCSDLQRVMVEAVADPGEYGYAKLYALLLGKCQKQLAAALRVFTQPDNFPLLVNCVQGKDRTGLIAMLVLMLCGVPHVVRLQPGSLHGHACMHLSLALLLLLRMAAECTAW